MVKANPQFLYSQPWILRLERSTDSKYLRSI